MPSRPQQKTSVVGFVFDVQGKIRQFSCAFCDAVNFFDEYGEICEPSATSSAADESSSVSHDSDSPFCNLCLNNQLIVRNILSEYLPDEDHPDYDSMLEQYPEKRRELEERYPPVCDKCKVKVDYLLQQNHFRAQKMLHDLRASVPAFGNAAPDSRTSLSARTRHLLLQFSAYISTSLAILLSLLSYAPIFTAIITLFSEYSPFLKIHNADNHILLLWNVAQITLSLVHTHLILNWNVALRQYAFRMMTKKPTLHLFQRVIIMLIAASFHGLFILFQSSISQKTWASVLFKAVYSLLAIYSAARGMTFARFKIFIEPSSMSNVEHHSNNANRMLIEQELLASMAQSPPSLLHSGNLMPSLALSKSSSRTSYIRSDDHENQVNPEALSFTIDSLNIGSRSSLKETTANHQTKHPPSMNKSESQKSAGPFSLNAGDKKIPWWMLSYHQDSPNKYFKHRTPTSESNFPPNQHHGTHFPVSLSQSSLSNQTFGGKPMPSPSTTFGSRSLHSHQSFGGLKPTELFSSSNSSWKPVQTNNSLAPRIYPSRQETEFRERKNTRKDDGDLDELFKSKLEFSCTNK